MPANIFLMFVAVLSLGHAVISTEWYTCLEFITVIASFAVCSILIPAQKEGPSADEFEQMKKVIGELATQIKVTNTKVSGLRIQKGLGD